MLNSPQSPPTENSVTLEYAAPPRNRRWPFLALLFLPFSLAAQVLLLPCLCGGDLETAKLKFAFALDALFLARFLLARYLKQQNRDWIIYGCILASSVFWIEEALTNQTIRNLYAHIGIHPY